MDLRETLETLLTAAVRFEAKAPHQKRMEEERRALAEAITQAQLLLSVAETEGQQRRLTMQEFEKAEEARAKAERQRGLADLAYRQHLGLSDTDYIDLRRVEVQKELV